ncbi:MAG: hypothetical protein JEY91_05605 [Spirochaetaceae bacterium]|nr:hypothetical protein [Spirochaetaceae bacterium]
MPEIPSLLHVFIGYFTVVTPKDVRKSTIAVPLSNSQWFFLYVVAGIDDIMMR